MRNINQELIAKIENDGLDPNKIIILLLIFIYQINLPVTSEDRMLVSHYLNRNQDGSFSCKYKIFDFEPDPKKKIFIDHIEIAEEIRNRFKGLKALSMGDKNDCIKKMQRFLKEYPEYSREEILEATDRYIETTPIKFIRRANYFIYKHTDKGEEISTLAMMLQEMNENIPQANDFNFINDEQ